MIVKGIFVKFILLFFCFIAKATSEENFKNYLVSITFEGTHFCTGSIIKPHVVLTTGGCFKDNEFDKVKYEDMTAFVGLTLRLDQKDAKPYGIKEVIFKEDYHSRSANADIALVILTQDVEDYNSKYGKLQLRDEHSKPGDRCQLIGWPKLYRFGPQANNIITLDLMVVDPGTCAVNPHYHKGQMCLATPTFEIIGEQVDRGSMLICNGKQGGIGQFRLSYASYFYAVNVPKYKDWVIENRATLNNTSFLFVLVTNLTGILLQKFTLV